MLRRENIAVRLYLLDVQHKHGLGQFKFRYLVRLGVLIQGFKQSLKDRFKWSGLSKGLTVAGGMGKVIGEVLRCVTAAVREGAEGFPSAVGV